MHRIYDKTGRFIASFDCSEHLYEQNEALAISLPLNAGVIRDADSVDPETHYFDLVNTVRVRPEMEAVVDQQEFFADGEDSICITGLPVPCRITVDGQEFILDDPEDNTFEFTTLTAGTYRITAEQFPYITKTWEVEAV